MTSKCGASCSLSRTDVYVRGKSTSRKPAEDWEEPGNGGPCMGADRNLLLLSVFTPVGSFCHDAAVIGSLRGERTWRGLDRRPVLLRVFPVQPGGGCCDGSTWATESSADCRSSGGCRGSVVL